MGQDEQMSGDDGADAAVGIALMPSGFEVAFDAADSYYLAKAHRPPIRRVILINHGWEPTASDLVIRARVESAVPDLLHPEAIEIPVIEIGDSSIGEVNLSMKPNFAVLAGLEEAVSAHIVVEVLAEGVVIAASRRQVDFLAYNQWMFKPSEFDLLSAFVLPSHPVVLGIMHRAREILAERTGSGATQGYQAGPSRVLEMLEAIFDALKDQKYEYSDPPASFEGYGQKIRTPDVVALDGVATCLDSALLFASCISAAGLRPMVSIVEGHAFVVCWMIDPERLTDGPLKAVWDNVNEVQNLFQKRLFIPIETTKITRSNALSFPEACELDVDYFTNGRVEKFVALIDPERSVEMGVRRLPVRNDGMVVVPESRTVQGVRQKGSPVPIAKDLEEPDAAGEQIERLAAELAPPRVKRWLESLLDLSSSNSLINLRSSMIGVQQVSADGRPIRAARSIDLPVNMSLLALIEDQLMSGSSFRVVDPLAMPGRMLDDLSEEELANEFELFHEIPSTDLGWVANYLDQLEKKVREDTGVGPRQAAKDASDWISYQLRSSAKASFGKLRRDADAIERESASNQLFLCIGTLVWRDPQDVKRRPLRSPLYLIPIRISGSADLGFTITSDDGGDLTPNYCLLEKLRLDLELVIPEMERPDLDDAGIDVKGAIGAIRKSLGEGKYKDIRVEESATLAVLDFATFRMWKDLKDNWSSFMQNPVVAHLVERPYESFEDVPSEIGGDLLCPVACDESQLNAVRWAAEGRSFVLEGPPGTGKSQTITNLIAACMALGKRVLFVAEKQTALNIVARNLRQVGLDPFCITIHHETATPEMIRSQLQDAFDFEGVDRSSEWETMSASLESVSGRLGNYRDALVVQNQVGHSLLKAREEIARIGGTSPFEIPVRLLEGVSANRSEIRNALLAIRGIVGSNYVEPLHQWSLCAASNFEEIDRDLLDARLSSLEEALVASDGLEEVLDLVLNGGSHPEDRAAIDAALSILGSGLSFDPNAVGVVSSNGWKRSFEEIEGRHSNFLAKHAEVIVYFTPIAFEADLSPQIAAAADAAASGLIGRKRRAKQMSALMSGITQEEETNPGVVVTMLQRVAIARTEAQSIREDALAIPHIALPQGWSPINDGSLNELRTARDLATSISETFQTAAVSPLLELVASGTVIAEADVIGIRAVNQSWNDIKTILKADESSINLWRNDLGTRSRISDCRLMWSADRSSYLELARWIRIIDCLKPLREAGLDDLVDGILAGTFALVNIYEDFERSLALASRVERLQKPPLDRFERTAHDSDVAEHVHRSATLKDLMSDVIPRSLLNRRPFKPKMRLGGVGKLERELKRKVRRVSLPRLMREHGETVTQLTPCFLMSPDAVSRLLPANEQFFDVVVFDEASQIRVAAAIPSMGRAKSVVVVGDSKQMPPSRSFARGGGAAADDEGVNVAEAGESEVMISDLESILSECRESNLPALMLESHFRSKHEGLIAFSNRNFYEGRLVTYPAPGSQNASPIAWHRVEGQFLRSAPGISRDQLRTNPIEAQAIVDEIARRSNDPILSKLSMGVVTFNEEQAALIIALLVALDDPAVNAQSNRGEYDSLFIRALERVQGDERDVVIFSVAFSYQPTKDGTGKTIPLNFGPLTNAGGERRLNVAVTRSKHEMVVFCSFEPEDMRRGEKHELSVGVAMLQDFLLMAKAASGGRSTSLRSREAQERNAVRRLLVEELSDNGIEASENIGLSRFRIDIAVSTKNSDGRMSEFLAILLDGESWAARSTVYDRDAMPDSVLRNVGWRRVCRVWAPACVTEPGHVVASIKAEIQREESRNEILRVLVEAGFEVSDAASFAKVGIDIAVRRPGNISWPLGLCIDAPNLFQQAWPYQGQLPSERFLKEADCHSSIGVWLPDWSEDHAAVISEIETAIAKAERSATYQREIKPIEGSEDAVAVEQVGSAALDPGFLSELQTPFRDASTLPQLGTSEMLDEDVAATVKVVRQAIDEIVALESPIAERRLASFVAKRFGLARVREARLVLLRKRFGHLEVTISEFGRFYWSPDIDASAWKGYRATPQGVNRDLEEIAPEEIANAMVDTLRMADGAYSEELIRSTATIFGKAVMTQRTTNHISKILDWVIASGRIKLNGDELQARPETPETLSQEN